MRPIILMLFGLSLTLQTWAAHGGELEKQFANPPAAARPWVWVHWLNGNVTKPGITAQLESIKRVGLGGVTMFDVNQPGIPSGPYPYFDAGWQEMFAFQIAEATRLGLETMSANGAGYSGSGGPWITPELAMQKIVFSSTRLVGEKKFTGKISQPPANGNFYRDVAVLAIRETDNQVNYQIEDLNLKRLTWTNYIKYTGTRSAPLDAKAPVSACISSANILNLTGRLTADGTLNWDVPAGSWTILRFGHTWTGQNTLPAPPAGSGPDCNKLDPRGIQTHFDHVMKRMIELAGPQAGKVFHTFFVDSWEAGGQNWTEKMPEEFQRRRGYDIIHFLPVMTGRVVGDLQTSERFLYDLRQTVSELCAENFWAEMQRLCHEHGMRLAVEPYITTGNDLDAANFTDEPMGECWQYPNGPITDYRQTIKAAASVADLNQQTIVGVEAFTSSALERWQSHPATLKTLGDEMFCLGANRFQLHRFAMQRFPQLAPGMMMGAWGLHYDSTQTWWEWSKPWHDYLARCQFLLRQGPVVADVLDVVPEEPLYRFEHKPIPGFDYDACGPDSFKRVTVKDGKLTNPAGRKYELMTVEHTGTMTLARLRQIRELVFQGANLLGEPPQATPGLEGGSQAVVELKKLADEIWGTAGETERAFGAGKVFRGITPAEALARLQVTPDFNCMETVSWIHRANADTDIYFIASAAEQTVNVRGTFRVSGRTAELWDPETGKIRQLDIVGADDAHTSVEVPLAARGSAFVVFRRQPAASPNLASVTRNGVVIFPKASAFSDAVELTAAVGAQRSALIQQDGDYVFEFANGAKKEFSGVKIQNPQLLGGAWRLSFPKDSGAPANLILDSLQSWSLLADENIRHFSGTAVYQKNFSLPEIKSRVLLDLGRVEVMARVRVNGKDCGILWKPPYCVDITDAVKAGDNTLEVSVVNLWVNRLIGDDALPEDSERDKKGRLTSWPQWVLDGKTSPTGRRSFVSCSLWKKDEPLKESGLLGPVTLRFPRAVKLEAEASASKSVSQSNAMPARNSVGIAVRNQAD